ncbi:penicillin-binding protein 1C [Nonlabens sp. Ci31]|uniref:penicillin-binding protein 1C n=1 Tax=Nonlabens sp. Ci31 TaxID=2608253 RepID=UPI00146460E9|nr:penicillin-binding protein 1C [Nonlabens sp. Ci31]QJP33893.1 penicillin-binding protein 1C [Nonlabens sp. Ci31]
MKKFLYKHKIKLSILTLLLVWYALCLPDQLFDVSYSTVIESKNGRLLDAHIAKDEQWRFPAVDSVPYRYKQCVLQYEDAYFYDHPGFNPVAIGKALADNITAGKVVRGGSTITQQVIRMSRKKDRKYYEKFIELIWATRLEIRLSKVEILELYASHAPYGGNVVGLDMAAWRYFGRKSHELSWAESATLAVLPNAPGLVYPGKRESLLQEKRDQVLLKLKEENIITAMDYELAISENVPTQDFRVPQLAPHLLQRANKEFGTQKLRTSIDYEMQETVNRIVKNHHNILQQNGVHNLAMLVLDVETQTVAAYVGNAPTTRVHSKDVDIIVAPRSTGSVLKPFLYAAMLDDGELLPHSLVKDTPTVIDGFSTENYDKRYTGAIPASQALSRSLNVPAVRLLREHTVPKFYNKLQDLKLTHINRGASTYGLSLIIGGGESSLWDMSRAYLGMAKTLELYTKNSSQYDPEVMNRLSYLDDNSAGVYIEPSRDAKAEKETSQKDVNWSLESSIYGAGSIYHTFEAMKKVNRPEGEEIWHFFNPDREIAWKTGTSFGNRDAWAIGVTPKYIIGVWTGNADGEGRADMTGIDSAAPVLFDLFNRLPTQSWFAPPYDDLIQVPTCKQSGYLATPLCESTSQNIPAVGEKFASCPFHKSINLDPTKTYQVNADCEPASQIVTTSWFTLPPVMSYYYARSNPAYKALPDYREDCVPATEDVMRFIQPKHNTTITLTKNVEGEQNSAIFEIAHKDSDAQVFWYMDDEFLGTTKNFHELAISGKKGKRLITAVDEEGNDVRIYVVFD